MCDSSNVSWRAMVKDILWTTNGFISSENERTMDSFQETNSLQDAESWQVVDWKFQFNIISVSAYIVPICSKTCSRQK